ncbi:fad binding domain protein [Diplodia corticola]|uniref:Fad binding domain protein n=1 Tax=Diplodia corticola TaxID=236234 RepID=A0A1J9R442_9PEZI|nr:fad binding domain protein [Diplodia corticola]OJD35345.1 fad binding domain protein [Diplodia corticola]
MATEQHVTVGIIGGGPAGLTLANILEQADISYTLFEARDDIAPPEGASLGLMPNGLRILDQIGLIDEVEEYAVAHDYWEYRDGNGTLYNTLHAMRSYPDILGYGGYFMERQRVLEILYEGIKDKSRVLTGKTVCSVQSSSTHATITTADGDRLSCDFIVGADGVRSLVRREIEAALPQLHYTPNNMHEQPGFSSPAAADHTCPSPRPDFATRYGCVYGISNALPQINPGRAFTVHQSDASLLIFSGAGGTLYWFLFVDLHDTIGFHAPAERKRRFTDDDLAAAYALVAGATVTAGVSFAAVFAAKRVAVMTGLEEGVADVWCRDRMLLLGDSAHKMTPHAAMGAMQAMESAAVFSSLLLALRASNPDFFSSSSSTTSPTTPTSIPHPTATHLLTTYQHRRHARALSVVRGANFHCETQLKVSSNPNPNPMAAGFLQRLPHLTNELWLNMTLDSLCRADMIDGWPEHRNGERVRRYVASARRFLDGAEQRMKRQVQGMMAVAGPGAAAAAAVRGVVGEGRGREGGQEGQRQGQQGQQEKEQEQEQLQEQAEAVAAAAVAASDSGVGGAVDAVTAVAIDAQQQQQQQQQQQCQLREKRAEMVSTAA